MFSTFKAILGFCVVATHLASAAALDFSNSKWIWIPGRAADGITYPPGNVTLRRDYYPPSGKTPLSAEIIITVDNTYTLFVNGRQVGTGTDFHTAQRYCVPLEPDCNVFAIEGQNVPSGTASNVGNAAGAISAIQVRYTDGFTETIVTDSEWHGVAGTPSGFQQVAFDDSAWPAAFVEGPYGSTPPWTTVSIPPATDDPGPNLKSASWIWTNEVAGGVAPIGGRAFRKTVTLPAGQIADSIVIDILADNEYTLYINGLVVGSGTSFTVAQRYQVNFIPSNTVTIAVYAANVPPGGPAGLLAAGVIRGCSCGCGSDAFVVTDASWRYSTASPSPAGFIDPGFDDSTWGQAVVEGPYGQSPWGPSAIPTENSPQSGPINGMGAPTAPPATVVS